MKKRPQVVKPLTKAWLDKSPRDPGRVTVVTMPSEVNLPVDISRPTLDEVVIFRNGPRVKP